MRAIVAESSDQLFWQEVADVSARPGEVVVKVAAAGVNRADVLQAAGKYPPPPGASEIIGMEVSGVITEVGDGVTEWSAGQEVCALLAGGGTPSTSPFPPARCCRFRPVWISSTRPGCRRWPARCGRTWCSSRA
ncbi:alcohol dehydrogenase GroES-like domain protein [Mycobacterium intracellulare 1956]|uniref:Alcohol dehydrogenase GroES-like domain protein n=1 Tax=Mycobacterium intracellulare 1956 TaxID=1299331 RepID=X8CEV4_MYCIT|nr:alcohol dehydrogenase GroES-like domain protein [Mycobacterium intracellulare 1956]